MKLYKGTDITEKISETITWKHNKTYLSAYRANRKKGFYDIHKNQVKTKESQFTWFAHLTEKEWVYAHDFKEAFIKALKDWNLWEV
tara:strand:- start:916 stop:1173 length:258 start_codon:yes stop_codon:yes gene_type:complete